MIDKNEDLIFNDLEAMLDSGDTEDVNQYDENNKENESIEDNSSDDDINLADFLDDDTYEEDTDEDEEEDVDEDEEDNTEDYEYDSYEENSDSSEYEEDNIDDSQQAEDKQLELGDILDEDELEDEEEEREIEKYRDNIGNDEINEIIAGEDSTDSDADSDEEIKKGIKIVDDDSIYNYDGDIVVMNKYGKAFDFKYIDIKNIIVTKDRIRHITNTDALERSISATGLLMPIVVAYTVTDGMYVLINGYKRLIACAKLGIKEIPCIINSKIRTKEMKVLEALYNHYTVYTINEIVDFIKYLENERGIVNQATVEYLAQLEPGEYPKLKDILNDNDDDIVKPLFDGELNIESAYKKLIAKRRKQSNEQKELEKAEKMYNDDKGDIVSDGVSKDIHGMGEEADEDAVKLSDEELEELGITGKDIDNLEDNTVEDLMEEGNSISGFDHENVQSSDERTTLDPSLRKAIISRDGGRCRCCGNAGVVGEENRLNMLNMAWADILDVHHIYPVFAAKVLGEKAGDTDENLITVCLNCHRSIHLWGYGQLHINLLSQEEVDKLSETDKILYNKELERLKKVIKLGNIIRDCLRVMGIAKEKARKKYSIKNIGREMPKAGKESNIDI